jgi:hemerythrin-like domain-containing protein
MTHVLSSLIREHQTISLLVGGLAGFAERLEDSEPARTEQNDLDNFARFFREFADEIHHEKEESILLPLLTRHGFCWEGGILAEVRQDHEHERYLIDVLCQAGERDGAWSAEDRRSIAATARALVEFQRAHLTRENEGLFPEVTRRLPDAVLEELRGELARFDEVPRHRTRSAALGRVAERLARRYQAGVSQGGLGDPVPNAAE